jgi:hypothetical protein
MNKYRQSFYRKQQDLFFAWIIEVHNPLTALYSLI